jgi:hypothetical protein
MPRCFFKKKINQGKYVKKIIILFLIAFMCLAGAYAAEDKDVDEGAAAYKALTSTADFNYRPEYEKIKYQKNNLIQDIAVTAIESIPFGFLLTFGGIYITKAAQQGTWTPNVGTLKDNTGTYIIAISSFAALNILINTLFFYDYKKEAANAETPEKK